MNRGDRTVELIGWAVAPSARRRFVEEWQADIAAARAVGLSRSEVVLAAARVAVLLLGLRLRASVRRERSRAHLLAYGVLLGLALTIADVPVDGLVPLALLLVGWRAWHAVLAWIRGAA